MAEHGRNDTVGVRQSPNYRGLVLVGLALFVGLGSIGHAQEMYAAPRPSTIVAQGKATIDVMPDHVDFWLHRRTEADTTEEAMREAVRFETQLQQELEKREMKNADLTVTEPTAPQVVSPEARVSARLRFQTVPFTDPNDGPGEFAKLCDQIRDISKTLNLGDRTLLGKRYGQAVEGPVFGAQDELNAETAAIALAVENAYPYAEAAARTMQTQIVAVETIHVDQIAWDVEPETPLDESGCHQISCIAKVTVTYAFAPL